MKEFRDLPIKRKMTVAVLGPTLAALLAACGAFLAYEHVDSREAMARNLSVLAEALASNSTAALTFGDADDAADTLRALSAEPSVEAACLYDGEGREFATYSRGKVTQVFPSRPEEDGTRFDSDRLAVVRPVILNGNRLGTLYLRADLTVITSRLRSYAQISGVILLISLLLAFVLATALQRAITGPISALRDTVQSIARTRDYAARAKRLGHDEIGTLTDGFNQMLAGIQERDSALQTANDKLLGEVAERRHAEEALRESEERLRAAISAAGTGTFRWDIRTNELIWDEALDALFGLPRGKTVRSLENFIATVHPDDRAGVIERCERCAREGADFAMEFRVIWPDGSQHWLDDLGKTFFDDAGQPLYMAGACVDITGRKRAEEEIRHLNTSLEQRVRERTAELETAVKELDAFSYSVSHDLRAPLRAVDGFSRMVSEDYAEKLDEDGRRKLAMIRSETQRMARLIDDLLAFSRLGRQKLELAKIDMRALAQAVFTELAAQEPERKLHLDLRPLPAARGTEAMIRQVWVNLISNAIKFTRKRETGEIEIGVRDGGKEGQVYYVKDNGAGFDMRHAAKLFGVFQRLHSATDFQGTGVGLALVQRIVQRHGGRIWAEAEINRGATFCFTLSNPTP